jgi:hypothetical protein
MNKLEEIHLKVIPKSSLACFEDTQQKSASQAAEITTDVAVKFAEFLCILYKSTINLACLFSKVISLFVILY